jgi:hypothetical protein
VFVVRLLVRGLVARRARGLLVGVSEHTRERLEQSVRELTEPVETAARLRGEALARLASLDERWRRDLGGEKDEGAQGARGGA